MNGFVRKIEPTLRETGLKGTWHLHSTCTGTFTRLPGEPFHRDERDPPMTRQIRMHLMFEGTAEEAMSFYVGLIPGSKILDTEHYEEGESKGKLKIGTFTLGGAELICIDSPIKHPFGFTPATSIFVDCESEEELERLYSALSEGGQVLMPLDNYGFSTKFGWVSDRFGVSWQLNLP